jgi:lysophospholipase L1-like esterase
MSICTVTGVVKDYDGETIKAGATLEVLRALPGAGSTTIFDNHKQTYRLKADGTWTPLLEFERGSIIYVYMNAPGFDQDAKNGTPLQIPNGSSATLASLAAAVSLPTQVPVVLSSSTPILIKSVDGSVIYPSISELQFDVGGGFVLTQPVPGKARLALDGDAIPGTGATGGVSNAGSTTIEADNDANGSGKISLKIAGVEQASIENDGLFRGHLNGADITSQTVERDQFGRYLLRNFAAQVSKIRSGANAVANVVYIGDSLVVQERYTRSLRLMLQAQLGAAGIGFVRFDSSGWPIGSATSSSGTWTEHYQLSSALGLHISDSTSSDTATPASKTIFGSDIFATEIVIHYIKKTGGGSFRYRVDAGSWTTINTSNASTILTTEVVSGLTYGVHQLKVEVTSAGTTGVSVIGADYHVGGRGLRLHMVGNTGSTTAQWASVEATLWQDSLAALDPHLVFIQFSTNDQSQLASVASVQANFVTLINRVRAAVRLADIVILSDVPTSNDGNPSFTDTSVYSEALQDVARNLGVAFVDFPKWMGAFDDAHDRGLMDDGAHPSTAGGQLLADALYAFINNGTGSPFQGGRFSGSIGIPYGPNPDDQNFYQLTSDGSDKLWRIGNFGNSLTINLTAAGGGINIGTNTVRQEVEWAFLSANVLGLGLGVHPSTRLHAKAHGGGVAAIIAEGVSGQSVAVIRTVGGGIDTDDAYKVDGVQVVSNRGAAVADATDNTTAITQLNALLARLRAHGLISS